MGKIEDAIKKIDDEIESMKGFGEKSYVRMVGGFLKSYITTEDAAEKILDKNKSLKGCYDQSLGKAKKAASAGANGIGIDGETLLEWMREYFGLEAIEKKPHLEVVKPQTIAEAPKKPRLSMDDFGF